MCRCVRTYVRTCMHAYMRAYVCGCVRVNDDSRTFQERSEVIATYAMCGFASLTAVGVALGVIRAIAPTRMKDASAVAMRAMIAGNGANFLTACIAGGLRVSLIRLSLTVVNSPIMESRLGYMV